jgi:hypothetical protein
MSGRWIVAVLLLAGSVQSAQAQAWQFHWHKGQVLSYKVKHHTAVAEVVDGSKVESESKLDLVKRWQIVDVDGQGVATLQMSLTAMRTEQKRPNGETLLFDSQDLDKSTPELKEQMAKFVGQTLAVLRLDGFGRTVDVKQGSLARYQAEPPFVLVFPKAEAVQGQAWSRPFEIVVEPPLGTGEKYEAVQKYQCSSLTDGRATVAVKTELKTQPESVQERLPLLQKEVEGTAVFDLKAGCLQSVDLKIDRTLDQHQGPRSNYRFRSEYRETLVTADQSTRADEWRKGWFRDQPTYLTPVRVHGGIGP